MAQFLWSPDRLGGHRSRASSTKRSIRFDGSFLPFGPTPSPADTFAFGEGGEGFPTTVVADRTVGLLSFEVKLDQDPTHIPATVDLRWEYLGPARLDRAPGTSSSTTPDLKRAGTVKFTVPDAVRQQVNGQAGYWVRARIAGGDYGEPADFEPVDLVDPRAGFRLRRRDQQPPAPADPVAHPGLRGRRHPHRADAERISSRRPHRIRQRLRAIRRGSRTWCQRSTPTPGRPSISASTRRFPAQPLTLYVAARRARSLAVSRRTASAAPASTAARSPLRWEYFNGTAWAELDRLRRYRRPHRSGTVEFLTPPDMASLAKFDLTARYWVRARSAANDPFDTPRLSGVFLNTVASAGGQSRLSTRSLGSSNGQPGQTLPPRPLARPGRAAASGARARAASGPGAGHDRGARRAPDAVQIRPNAVTRQRRRRGFAGTRSTTFLASGPAQPALPARPCQLAW